MDLSLRWDRVVELYTKGGDTDTDDQPGLGLVWGRAELGRAGRLSAASVTRFSNPAEEWL